MIPLTRTAAAPIRACAALASLALAVGLFGASEAPAVQQRPPGIGDSYFPNAGNPGYDVRHYAVRVRYRPGTGLLTGDTRIRVMPNHRLTRISLDLVLHATGVTVNGVRTLFSQTAHELIVRPRAALRAGHIATIRVRYTGHPARTRYGGETPFERTATGAIAVGEPQIAAWWFPSNDHPSDKATFKLRLTVPQGRQAISNGAMVGMRRHDGLTTWYWRVRKPMATYLAFAAFGHYDIEHGLTQSGLQYLYAFERGLGPQAMPARVSVRQT
ncbi:MAG TPA: M1 family peptidase, partial [Nocardioidaceae bacterium]|nr:M1 family peptidase [Nocardioidaceae bacterium]